MGQTHQTRAQTCKCNQIFYPQKHPFCSINDSCCFAFALPLIIFSVLPLASPPCPTIDQGTSLVSKPKKPQHTIYRTSHQRRGSTIQTKKAPISSKPSGSRLFRKRNVKKRHAKRSVGMEKNTLIGCLVLHCFGQTCTATSPP